MNNIAKLKRAFFGRLNASKALCTFFGIPWVRVLDHESRASRKFRLGALAVDWNKPFINKLRREGYDAAEDEVVIEWWMMDLMREAEAAESAKYNRERMNGA